MDQHTFHLSCMLLCFSGVFVFSSLRKARCANFGLQTAKSLFCPLLFLSLQGIQGSLISEAKNNILLKAEGST